MGAGNAGVAELADAPDSKSVLFSWAAYSRKIEKRV
jgi:hypothetical protein